MGFCMNTIACPLEPYLPKARRSTFRAGAARYLDALLASVGKRDECERISKRLPGRSISNSGAPYLERYSLAPDVYLHRFIGSDEAGLFHNHPWDESASLMLWGGYVEERLDVAANEVTRRRYDPGSVNTIGPDDYHRVDLVDEEAWTLFLAGRPNQSWGFLRS